MGKAIIHDLDDTHVPFMSPFISFYNTKHGANFKLEDFNIYDILKILGISLEKGIQEII